MRHCLSLALVIGVLSRSAPTIAEEGNPASSQKHPLEFPVQPGLPDPLRMLDGRMVTTQVMWRTERRPELIRLFQDYMYGQLPSKPGLDAQVERVDIGAFGGKATLSEVALKVGPAPATPIQLMLIVPNVRNRPAPVVLSLNYFGNHTLVHDRQVRLSRSWMPERGEGVVDNRATEASRGTWAQIWPIEEIIDRGYAVATFYNGDVAPDMAGQPILQPPLSRMDRSNDCGTIGAWAWGLQRAVDYLVTLPSVDSRRIVVTGHSRTGKAALLAAALDERIALCIPHQAGCGGSAPSRARLAIGQAWNTLDGPERKRPETVTDINEKFPHWFNERFKEFNAQPERLPFDQHCLVALCAPRPVLFSNGRADTWINPAGQFLVMQAAAPVYRLLDAGDFTAKALPPDGEIIGDKLGYYLRAGGHSLLRQDWKLFLDFADRRLGSPAGGTAQATAGPIVVDSEFPHSFRRRNGDHFFPMGDTAYFLIAQPTNVIARYLDSRREQGFNFVRAMAMAEGFWPFGGTPKVPDYSVLDQDALKKWDWVFDYAASRDVNFDLILWGYGSQGGEGLWGDARAEDLWIHTLVERFKRRPNLFMWTVANEFERYPDGKYVFRSEDVEWAKRVAARIRELDPVHSIGCHPSVWITDQDTSGNNGRRFARYRAFTQRPPQVVWPLWQEGEVNLLITQNNEGVHPRTWGVIGASKFRGVTYGAASWQGLDYPARWTSDGWDFDAAGLENSIAEDGSHGKPVLNMEFGYQHEPGYETEHSYITRQCHSPESVRRKAWKIAMSGGYFAAGYESTAVRHFTVADTSNFRPSSLRILRQFFTGLPFWRLRPFSGLDGNALALADGDQPRAAYLPRGGTVTLRLPAAGGQVRIRWFNPRTGEFLPQAFPAGHSRILCSAPDSQDWALLIEP